MKERFSERRGISKLVILYVLSFGLYPLYWMLANWGTLQKHHDKKISVGWKRFGMFIPFYNIYLIWKQVEGITQMVGKKVKMRYEAGALFALFIGTILLSNFIPETSFLLLDFILGSFVIIPVILVQNYMNKYFDKIEKKKTVEKLRTGEVIVSVIGILFWYLLLFF